MLYEVITGPAARKFPARPGPQGFGPGGVALQRHAPADEFLRQVFGKDLVTGSHYAELPAEVEQLPHVAWPAVTFQHAHGLRTQAFLFQPQFGRHLGQEALGQQGDVLAPRNNFV